MGAKRISLRKFTNCLKLNLGFERWVNESHTRSQLRKSRKLLGELITMIQECFPRTDGWGWNLPKMHAFAKMPYYMLRFGSANNFSGQIGERALKESSSIGVKLNVSSLNIVGCRSRIPLLP